MSIDNHKPHKLSARDIDEILAETSIDFTLTDVAPDFKHTIASRKAESGFRSAYHYRYPVVVLSGPAGTSKSSVAKRFQQGKGDVSYIRCYPGFSMNQLQLEMSKAFYLSYIESHDDRRSTLIDVLTKRYQMVVLDEAQLIDRKGMEMVKYFVDQARCTFVLVMTNEHVDRLMRWRDIASRTALVVKLEPVSLDEFRVLYDESGLSEAVIDEVHHITGGVMRDVARLMGQVDEVILLNDARGVSRASLLPRHIRVIAQKLNLGGGLDVERA